MGWRANLENGKKRTDMEAWCPNTFVHIVLIIGSGKIKAFNILDFAIKIIEAQ